MNDDWSPEQITYKLNQLYGNQVSREWMHHHMQEDKQQGAKLNKHLRSPKKYRKLAGKGHQQGQISQNKGEQ